MLVERELVHSGGHRLVTRRAIFLPCWEEYLDYHNELSRLKVRIAARGYCTLAGRSIY